MTKLCSFLHTFCQKCAGSCTVRGRAVRQGEGPGARGWRHFGAVQVLGAVCAAGRDPWAGVRLRASASSHGAFQKSSASVHSFCSLPADLSSPPDLSAMPAAKRKRARGGKPPPRKAAVKRSAKAPDKNDHYGTLGISAEERDKIIEWDDEMDGEDRSDKAIKHRFMALARQYHPEYQQQYQQQEYYYHQQQQQQQQQQHMHMHGGYGGGFGGGYGGAYGGADAPGDDDGDDYGGGGGGGGGFKLT